MHTYNYSNDLLLGGISAQSLAEKYGTPTYVYCMDTMLHNYQRYVDALSILPDAQVFFAMKSNDNMAILQHLVQAGAGLDVVSHGEYERALRSGVAPEKIVYSGVGKTKTAIAYALVHGVLELNVESIPELHLINQVAEELDVVADIALRVNPDVDAKTHAKISTGSKENKFGIDIDLALDVYKTAQAMKHINPVSVAVHIGSQLTRLQPYRDAYRRVRALVLELKSIGIDLHRIDLGGGIGIAYHNDETLIDYNDYAQMVQDTLGDLGVSFMVEPGRSISANGGVLLTQVEYIKEGVAKNFIVVDSAMNDLLRPSLYDGYHHFIPAKGEGFDTTVDIVGPVCETGDTFATDVQCPTMQRGDLGVFLNCGAYGSVMAGTYNTRPLLAEVLIGDGKDHLIRQRQTLDELINRDIMPPMLTKKE